MPFIPGVEVVVQGKDNFFDFRVVLHVSLQGAVPGTAEGYAVILLPVQTVHLGKGGMAHQVNRAFGNDDGIIFALHIEGVALVGILFILLKIAFLAGRPHGAVFWVFVPVIANKHAVAVSVFRFLVDFPLVHQQRNNLRCNSPDAHQIPIGPFEVGGLVGRTSGPFSAFT